MSQERDQLVTEIMQHPWLKKSMFTGYCPTCPDLTIEGGHNSPSHAGHIADAILAAGYRKPRTIATEDELADLPQGTKLYSPRTTDSWVLNDLSVHGGVRVHGTGGGFTFIRDFILHEAPLVVLNEPQP